MKTKPRFKIQTYRPNAQYLRTIGGKRYFRYPCEVRENGEDPMQFKVRKSTVFVIAESQSDAAELLWAEFKRPNTEITVYGPRGGKREFFQGWHSAIGRALLGSR